MINIPNINATNVRFKVEPTNNIFYDINNADITITKSAYVVDKLGDVNDGNYGAGQLTLREAVILANAASGSQTIAFSPSVFNTSTAPAPSCSPAQNCRLPTPLRSMAPV